MAIFDTFAGAVLDAFENFYQVGKSGDTVAMLSC